MAEYDTATRWGDVHPFNGGIARDSAAHAISEGLSVEAVNMLADRDGFIRGRTAAISACGETRHFGEFMGAQRDRNGLPCLYAWGHDDLENFLSGVRFIDPLDPAATPIPLFLDDTFPDHRDYGPAAYYKNVLVAGNKAGQWSKGGLLIIGTARGVAGGGDSSCRMLCVAGSTLATVTSGEVPSNFEAGQIAVGNAVDGSGRGYAVYVISVSNNGSGQPVLEFDRPIDWSGNFDGGVTAVWPLGPFFGAGKNRSGRLPFSYGGRLGVANTCEFDSTGSVFRFPRRVIYTALMIPKDFPAYALRIASVPIAEQFLANNYIEIAGSGELTAVLPVQGGVLFFDLETVTRFEGAFVTQNGDIGGSFGQQYLLSQTGCLDCRTLKTTPQGSIFLSRDGLMVTNGGKPEPLLTRYARDMLRDMLQAWTPNDGRDREASGAIVRGHYVLTLKDVPEQLVVNLQNGHVTTWKDMAMKDACAHPSEPWRTYALMDWDIRLAANETAPGGAIWEIEQCFPLLDGMTFAGGRTTGLGEIVDPASILTNCDVVMRPQVEDAAELVKRFRSVKITFDGATNSDEDADGFFVVYGQVNLDPRINDLSDWFLIGNQTFGAGELSAGVQFRDFTLPVDLKEGSALTLRIVAVGFARFHLYSVRIESQVRREGSPAL